MKFEIKNRFTLAVQFTCELDASSETKAYSRQLGEAVKKANLADANLYGADLRGANLRDADLADANLRDADLRDANLRDANLRDANLYDANLYGANLRDANLRDANLYGANLRGADLRGADLADANLRGADLRGADLYGADLARANLARADLASANLASANLRETKEDFISKLLLAKNEVLGLYDYLMKGKINGSAYQGECACFCGTIANIRNENYNNLGNGIKPNPDSPTEKWFLAINQGDIPQNNQVSAITAEWMRELMDKEGIKYPRYEIVAVED